MRVIDGEIMMLTEAEMVIENIRSCRISLALIVLTLLRQLYLREEA